jgi:hypothetical protein
MENSMPPEKPSTAVSNTFPEKNHHSKIFKIVVAVLAELIILIGVFSLGLSVGFHKAGFTFAWGQNYANNFVGRKILNAVPPSSQFFNAHGVDGTILSLSTGSLVIKDADSNEKTLIISDQTAIRQNFQSLKASDLKVGQEIIAIGQPNPQGQIEAKLIRVLNP